MVSSCFQVACLVAFTRLSCTHTMPRISHTSGVLWQGLPWHSCTNSQWRSDKCASRARTTGTAIAATSLHRNNRHAEPDLWGTQRENYPSHWYYFPMTLGLCTVCSLRARTLSSLRDNCGWSVELVTTGRPVSFPHCTWVWALTLVRLLQQWLTQTQT